MGTFKLNMILTFLGEMNKYLIHLSINLYKRYTNIIKLIFGGLNIREEKNICEFFDCST